MTTNELLRQVRMVGRYGWMGGYTHAVMLDDGETLCPRCTHDNYCEVSRATRHHERSGWEALAVFAIDGEPEVCAHCGREIT